MMSAFKSGTAAIFLLALISAGTVMAAPPTVASLPAPNTVGFAEPLVKTKVTLPNEDADLSAALSAFQRRRDPSDLSSLMGFLQRYPHGGWSTALWTNIGLSYLHDGYFSRAIDAWQRAWIEGKDASVPEARALTDRAVGELASLNASMGRSDDLALLFSQLDGRKVSGPATETIQSARDMLTLVKTDPRHLFNCGPLALRALLLTQGMSADKLNFLQFYNAGPEGTTLAELGGLASKVKLDYRLIRRSPDEAVPVPSVVHWKVGHFAAIVGKANGRYHVQDAVFPNADMWVTPDALNAEASGYFLVPASEITSEAWEAVSMSQAVSVRGKGSTNSTRQGDAGDPNANGPGPTPPDPTNPSLGGSGGLGGNGNQSPWPQGANNNQNNGDNNNQCPLCVVNIKESSVSVALSDVPVGYVPPIGPSMKIGISYNQREDSQPANFDYFNIGQKWSLSWSSYIIDDPTNPGANVSRIMGEGGAFYYLGYDTVRRTFAAQDTDGSILSLVSQSPVSYRRQLRNGGMEIYEQSDGSAAYPRKIFLSKVVDPQGNAATLHYDSQKRLTSITDAVGRDTTFSYGVPGRPLLVSQITDPFGRSAVLAYDGQGRLMSITDIIGLTSSFTYDANSLINALTTPYGTTRFSYTAPGTSSPPRFVQVTDPLGNKEREEWLEPAPIPFSDPTATVPVGMPLPLSNTYLPYRNSFHWDKSAYVTAGCTDTGGCDYTKARIRHFVHMPASSIKGTAIESEKKPLENRVWYTYPGQTGSTGTLYGGTYNKPTAIGRVLDDGTSQISLYSYDSSGNLTQATDPAGRITYYSYSNGIDLVAVSQADQFGAQSTLAQYIYNKQHRPIFYSDAAGQTSTIGYNAVGQLTSFTNALGEKTTYQYDANANLVSVTNANNATAATYTYDGFARVRTYTDSEGWTVTYDYDAADRVTKITYPDGTSQRYTYQRLDLVSYQDREGRLWRYQYDANRRLTAVVDPMRQTTKLGYDPAGNLVSLTDPKGNVTVWAYDVQDRQTLKTYADNTQIAYTYETTTSRLKSVLDALGQTKQYSYAIDSDLIGLTYLNAVNPTPNVSLAYDPYFDRVTSMTDGVGTTSYSYNPSYVNGAQQLAQECFTATGASSCSHTIAYGYDALGRTASRQVSSSGAETFQYDAIGRVTNHSSDLGAFQISYLGQTPQIAVRQLLPATSTLKTTWSYLDNAHDRRLSGIANTGLTSGQYTNFTFQSSPENFISGITQDSDTSVADPSPAMQAVSFNNLNEITQASGQGYSYDANGNLLSDGERAYSWDAENRLIGITYPLQSGKLTKFAYDGRGRRIEIDDTPAGGGSAVTSKYIWCGSKLCQARDAAYSPKQSYFTEGEFKVGAANPALFYGIDQVGSVRRVFQSATAAPAYDYDPWGVALQTAPTLTDFGFAGTFSHFESRLTLTRVRAYNPKVGRWVSRDPLGEGASQSLNLYSYVENSPLANTDPSGQISILPPWLLLPSPGPNLGACPVPNNFPDLSGPLFNQDYDDYPGNTPPYRGKPNSTVRGGTQSRTYGPDGYPARDRDTPHPDEKGIGSEDHVHDWTGRSHEDRGPGRAPQDGDPPVPRGANK
ncbi:RHS repeat-associated protein [Rhizobium sp. ERR 922]|uniref:RHS repeat-associated core domain-containing protein n=1 Tax=unclassified Rhizobium TaxID=2613769 RepID=UPI0011AE1564|nr:MULTISPECIES: RHS repeat-associated core domain-containing protein [unclassified Rhizobium]TWB45575.1 RHS repeat-associated protein [Rhizobium sp. ERR 922]TWB88189.1 RHS repeat-associated protein [Rhizobium sp. ERR 942]